MEYRSGLIKGKPRLDEIIIIGRDNAYGLSRDLAILKEALDRSGSSIRVAQPRERSLADRLMRRRCAHTVIHLERVFPRWLGAGEVNWLVPNEERFPRRHLHRLAHVDLVLTKTRHGHAVFSKFAARTAHIGFTSPDRRMAGIEKNWRRAFHLAGGSTLKGTEEILALWARHPEWPELVLVQKEANAPRDVPANVRLIAGYLDDAELKRLQNECGLHLCPSRSEGWGHYVLEGMSCGSVVVTTDAPPMNEHVTSETGVLVPWSRSEPRHMGRNHYVDTDALEAAVARLLGADDASKSAVGKAARQRYEAIDAAFHEEVERLVGEPDAISLFSESRNRDG